jgi:Flp pilus assembly protein TadG
MRALFPAKMRIKEVVRSDRGTSLVEFALVAPMLLFLLVGLIEVGRYATFAIMAASAARAGAQYGTQNLTTAIDTTGMEAAALQDGQNIPNFAPKVAHLCSVNGAALTTCPSMGAGGMPANTVYYVRVQVTGTFKSLLNYPGIPPSIPVSGSIVMRVTGQ